MCLRVVDPNGKNENAVGIGWKMILPRDAQTFSLPWFSATGEPAVWWKREKSNYYEWLEAKSVVNESPCYETGFHIFANEKDARWALEEFRLNTAIGPAAKVAKVRYRDVLATGKTFVENSDIQSLDGYLPTIVAKFMLVEPPE